MPLTKTDNTKEESQGKDELFSVFICGAVGVRWAYFKAKFRSGISKQPQ